MPARLLPFAAALAALLATAAGASARVSATVSGRVLVVDGTTLHDEIVVSLLGSNLRVDDKDRVNANTGCSRSDDVALCPRSAVDSIRIDGDGSADSIQVNGNTPVPSHVSGGNGDDTISVFSGADGNELAGDADNDILHDGQGDDLLEGGPGDDTLEGAPGADRLRGDAGQDVLRGGFGDDDLVGGDGADSIFGDDGDDTVTYPGSAGVTVRLGSTGGNGGAADAPGDVLNATVENATGGSGPDTLIGTDGANALTGNQGDDTLDGAGGDDVLKPATGVDVVHGGGGRDTVSWDPLNATLTVLGVPGASGTQADRDAGGDTIDADVEDVQGGPGSDAVIGTAGANTFRGGTGFDTMLYVGRTAKVVADADGVADDGAVGEGDNIGVDVEGITGGDGDDELTATDSSDGTLVVPAAVGQTTVQTRLAGGIGFDALVGSDVASDELIGGPNIDGLVGRSGNDIVEAQGDGGFDNVDCGPGLFDFAKLDLVDGFGVGCETVQIAAVGRHPTVAFSAGRVRLARGVLRVGLSCPREAAGACRGVLEAAGAKASFAVPRGAKRTVRVRLGTTAAKRVRKAGRVRLTATEKDPEGRPKTSATLARLR